MSVLERVKSGLGIKVVEPQQQPFLRVQEAQKQPTVRVTEGGGFAPLKVTQAPLQPQIRVSGAEPAKDLPVPLAFKPEVREKMEIERNLKRAVQPQEIKQIGDTLSNFLARIDPLKPRQDTPAHILRDITILGAIENKTPEAKQELARLTRDFGQRAVDIISLEAGSVTRNIIGAKTRNEAISTLKKVLNITDDVAKRYADDAVRATTDAQALKVIDDIAKETTKIIPPDLQPYQMTRQELANKIVGAKTKGKIKGKEALKIFEGNEGRTFPTHSAFIEKALQEGREVPEKVLNEYPWIKEKYAIGFSPDLQPLAQEARKYKSAEEFVAKTITASPGKDYSELSGLSKQVVAPDSFGKPLSGKGDIRSTQSIDETQVRKYMKQIEDNVSNKKLDLNPPVIIDNYRGFNEIIDGHNRAEAYRRLGYADAPIITKSQLTDIYNQAVKGAKALPELPKAPKAPTDLLRPIDFKGQQQGLDLIDSGYGETNLFKQVEKKGVPTTIDDFEKLPFIQQESIFSQLPKNLQDEIMGVTKADVDVPNILKDIRGLGGIKSAVKKEFESFEFEEIPLHIRNNKTGISPDELPDALRGLGYSFKSGDEVLQAVVDASQGKGAVARISTLPEKLPTFRKAKTAIERLITALKSAKPAREATEELYSIERARRAGMAEAVGQKVSGEKGFFAQLKQLKGELPKAKFEPVRSQFAQSEIDSLFDVVQGANILPFEKITAKSALAGLFEGRIPTRNEIDLLRDIFPKNFIDAILSKRTNSEKFFSLLGELINVPRTMMASIDFSAPLRQGIFLIGRPKEFLPSFAKMFKYAFSEKAYQEAMEAIKVRPTYQLMRKHKLALTEIGGSLNKAEEAFMGNIAERIPGLGRLIKISNRAYTGFLNQLRADVFDSLLKHADSLGVKKTDEMLDSLTNYINAASGRGNLPKAIERAAPVLNATFFSPRLMTSRLNLLNPYFYATLDPFVRKQSLRDLLIFGAVGTTVLGLASLDDDVEIGADPRSADFGKIKAGNSRYDIFGGFQQYIRFAAQMITGEIVSSTTGRTMTVGEGFGMPARFDVALRFFENKTAPIPSFIVEMLKGETAVGQDFDVPTEIANRFTSFVVQDLYDLSQEKGIENIWQGLPAIFGVGVQTYGKQELAFGESKIGEPTAQVRPIQGLTERLREATLGQLPLGTSKGFSVEAYWDQLNELPREEAADVFDKIIEANPELAKKINDVIKEQEKGITPKDKDLKAKGVTSGDRALAVQKEIEKLDTKEAQVDLWDEYVTKGIITKEVARQLTILLQP